MKGKLFSLCMALLTASAASAQSWQYIGGVATAISAGTSATYTSVAINSNGAPYVAYRDNGASNKATVLKYDGAVWAAVGAPGFSTGSVSFTSLAIGMNDTPYVAYTDIGSASKAVVRKYDGANWITVGLAGFSAGPVTYTSLAIDGSGTPYVAYVDNTNGYKATVMKYNGSAWVTVGTAGFSTGSINYISLAIDGAGTPYVAFQDAGNSNYATVMKYDGAAWATVGTAGFSGGQANYTALAIDGSGTPYVAYEDVGNSNKATVKKFNGAAWVTVGTAGFSAIYATYIALAIDGSGTPYVSYEDYGNSSKASVMKFNGSAWVNVGTAGFSGGTSVYTALAIKGNTGYISYNSAGAHVEQFTPLFPMWTGASGTDYNTAANWSTNTVPTSTDGIVIPAGVVNMPMLSSGTDTLNNFAQSGADSLIIAGGATLYIRGNMTDSGMIKGAGMVTLGGTAAQTITGNGAVSNLTLNDTAGAMITTGSNIKVTGAYTNTAGILTTDSALTLVNNANGTGRIAAVTAGSINGKVNVQQYIPAGRRAYRFFSHPFSSAIGLNQLENYIDITGTGGSANGFTNTQNNNPSAFWYNTAAGNSSASNDLGWTAFTSTNGSGNNAWNAYEGVRVLIRGAQGQGLDGSAYTPSATAFIMNGTVNQGNVTIPFTTGTNSHYNVLGNPYPSPTNIGGAIYTAKQAGAISGSAYYVWNANQQTQGAYVTLPIDSSIYNLPMNAAFVINAATSGSLAFTEANKVSTGTALFKATADNKYTKLTINDNTGDTWDALYVSFNPNASATSEDNDADKMHNTALDFYTLSSDNKELSIDARPYANGQVIPLGLQTSVQQVYTIKADAVNVPNGAQLMLHDKYLGQYETLTQGSEYTFTITNDANSQGDNRFELSTTGATSVAAVGSGSLQVSVSPNPASDKAVITYSGANDNVRVSVTDVMGRVVYTTSAANNNGTITLPMQGLSAGYYMVVTQCGNQKIVNKLVKE